MNIYKDILTRNLPRLLSLYNLDAKSQTLGWGDRLHWGWKISDFANGTMQGGVHALAIALKLDLMENEEFTLKVIDNAIKAISKIQSSNGSMVESYPGENSFCVTALVAFDVLAAIHHLGKRLVEHQKIEYLRILRPLIRYISLQDEEHAVISNHLATAAAALSLWCQQSGEHSQRESQLLERIFECQSKEGWFQEYESADPGYQTLCTYYLYHIWNTTRNAALLERLNKSAEFLKYFVHPDGTIGGLYGSRNSEVYYPGGIVALASISGTFALIGRELERGIKSDHHILPEAIDIGNFIPLINAYAVAALHYEKSSQIWKNTEGELPCRVPVSVDFAHAGIYIRSNSRYYIIVNYKKGGTLKVFDKKTNRIDLEDGGIFGCLKNGVCFSTQQFDPEQKFVSTTVVADFYQTNEKYPGPFSHVIMRLLGLTLFRSVWLGNQFKKCIVYLLMTRRKRIDGQALRRFEFHEDKVIVLENIDSPRGSIAIDHFGKCMCIHMASSGYYLRQVEQLPQQSDIVEFKLRIS